MVGGMQTGATCFMRCCDSSDGEAAEALAAREHALDGATVLMEDPREAAHPARDGASGMLGVLPFSSTWRRMASLSKPLSGLVAAWVWLCARRTSGRPTGCASRFFARGRALRLHGGGADGTRAGGPPTHVRAWMSSAHTRLAPEYGPSIAHPNHTRKA